MQTNCYFLSYRLYYRSFTGVAVCLMIIDSSEGKQEEVILSIEHRDNTMDKDEEKNKNFTLLYTWKTHHMSMIELPNLVKAALSLNLILIFFLIIFTRII